MSYLFFSVEAPVISMLPKTGSPIYSNVEAPLSSASRLPSRLMVASLAPLRITSVLIALVNRVYRASFHLALFTSMTVPLVLIFGPPSFVVVPFLLLLGFSRYILGEHTPTQIVTGFFIGLLVSIGTFWVFGLLS